MAKKLKNWNTTCNRFVAFIDIMGFKDMVLRSSHEEVHKILISFRPTIGAIEWDAKRKLSAKSAKTNKIATLVGKSIIRPVIFSDSIILVSSDDSKDAAGDMLFNVEWIFKNAILQGIPVKGAIAHGEQTADFENSLHFGRPLIDAYELQDELILYGAVLHHTMEKHLTNIGIIKNLEHLDLFKLPIPMRSGKITHYIIDWTTVGEENENVIDIVSNLYNNVSGKPRLYVDNTIEFVRWIMARKEEFAKKRVPSRPSKQGKKVQK